MTTKKTAKSTAKTTVAKSLAAVTKKATKKSIANSIQGVRASDEQMEITPVGMKKDSPTPVDPINLEIFEGRIGRANAVQYPLTLPFGRTVLMDRYMQWVGPKGNLIFDPVNLRLHTALIKNGLDPTQENLAILLADECKELIPSLRISGGLHGPILLGYDHKTVKEGNRRLYSFRQLRQENEIFDLIPVEAPAEKVTDDEMELILTIRHCVRPKGWESREQGRMIKRQVAKLGKERIADLIGRDEAMIQAFCMATDYYDDFDDWANANPKIGEKKNVDRDWFTYFLKIAQKTKFVNNVWDQPEERKKLHSMMAIGQFNDCLNIDQIGRVWDNPKSRKALEEGLDFNDCVRLYNKDMTVRRGEDLWPNVKKTFNTLKKLTGPQKRRLALEEGSADLNTLEKLRIQIQLILAEVQGLKVHTNKKTG